MTTENEADPLVASWKWNTSRLHFLPIAELEAGPTSGMCEVISDFWWIVHPTLGAIFYRVPGTRGHGTEQGHYNAAWAQHFRDDRYPGAVLRFFHRIYVPIDLNDYR